MRERLKRGLRPCLARMCFAVAVVAIGMGDVSGAEPAAVSLDFPQPLSPDLPYDVDVDVLRQLDRDGQVPEAQRLFDIFAWQAFVALNWPATSDGTPDRDKTIADSRAPRVWMGWRTNESVYLPDGSMPAPWDPAKDLAAR